MHGRVIGPKLMLEMHGTCCALRGSWAVSPKGFVVVEAYLYRLRWILHNLREVWLEPPSIDSCLVYSAGSIHQLIASIIKFFHHLEWTFAVWHKLITLVIIKPIIVAQNE